jgi:hypothetical protein
MPIDVPVENQSENQARVTYSDSNWGYAAAAVAVIPLLFILVIFFSSISVERVDPEKMSRWKCRKAKCYNCSDLHPNVVQVWQGVRQFPEGDRTKRSSGIPRKAGRWNCHLGLVEELLQ